MTTILHFLFVVFAYIFMLVLLIGVIYWAIFLIFLLPYAVIKNKLGRLPWL